MLTLTLTSSSTLRQIWSGFCEQLSASPQAFSSPHWQGLFEIYNIVELQMQWGYFLFFFFFFLMYDYYQCHRSPWLEYRVSACSRSEEWLPPCPRASRSVASRSWWSCTSADKHIRAVQTQNASWFWDCAPVLSSGGQTWVELAGLGAILHSSWLPGITSTVSAAGEATSSWASLLAWTPETESHAALKSLQIDRFLCKIHY